MEAAGPLSQKNLDIRPIAAGKIFGPISGGATSEEDADAKAKSDAPLSLVGTFIDGGQPFAIVQDDKNKTQDIFSPEELIFGAAKLIKINSDSIEIKRGDKIETLYLDEGGDVSATSSVSSEYANIAESTNITVEAMANLPLLLTQARAVPYFKDGKSVGLRLFAIKTGSLFEKIGLKNGDILKEINGSGMADITQAIKLFERLKEDRSIKLVLERAKVDVVYNYEIR